VIDIARSAVAQHFNEKVITAQMKKETPTIEALF
jgi:hypothetical protein